MTARVCGRPCRARGRSVRKDGRTALAPAAVATKRLPVCGQRDTNGFTALRGCRHRGTGQPASLRRSRRPERRRSSTSRRPRSAALVRMLCPYEELQPVESCPCDALDSPALCCLEGPEEAHEHGRGPVCGHARTCCCTRR